MELSHLGIGAALHEYARQAENLLAGHAAGASPALNVLRRTLPQFLDPVTAWLPLPLSDDDIAAASLDIEDARLAVARAYTFRDWAALETLVSDMHRTASPVRDFEIAAEAVVDGDLATLSTMLGENPGLAHARSTRITCLDPPQHRATLLHYVGANGVESHRQRSPANAVEIARLLLDAGSQPDALADMYGGECATLSMLVSSTPPADAGVQLPLMHLLVDYGANVEGAGTSAWQSPLLTALKFRFSDAAAALVARGAAVDDIVKAAGLGQLHAVEAMLSAASAPERHCALALAVETEQVKIVQLLLAAGVSPARLNPEGFHAHQTPLHSAAHHGNMELVQLLLDYDAPTTTRDTLWHSTPLGWAEHEGLDEVAALLRDWTPAES